MKRISVMFVGSIACLSGSVWAQPAGVAPAAQPAPVLDWKTLESPLLTGHVQITSRDMFLKAGESYFNSDATWIIFQAIPTPKAGEEPGQLYSMFVAKLTKDDKGNVTGIEKPVCISPEGSFNTCGWFHPTKTWKVLFGSTLVHPAADQRSGFNVGTRKYTWMFPEETEIVTRNVIEIAEDVMPGCPMNEGIREEPDAKIPQPLFTRPHYQAECSYSADGRFVLYAHVREPKDKLDRPDADIWVYDTATKTQYPLVEADGYDGGPFFSPNGKQICYRSDRRGDDMLQLFIADLKFDSAGVPVGIEREHQLTDNQAVNWAPYWHPSGKFIVFGSSQLSHQNYEIFAIEASMEKAPKDLPLRRVTQANGADVLPVFSNDGKLMMWTAQRGPLAPGEQRASSQIWIARSAGADAFLAAPAKE